MKAQVVLDNETGYKFELMHATSKVFCTKYDDSKPTLGEWALRWVASTLFVEDGNDLYIGVLK